MRKRDARLESIESKRAGGQVSEYRRAIHLTNVTGLASLRDYELAFAPLAMETRQQLCAATTMYAAMERVGGPVSGAVTAGVHPPGDELPLETRRDLTWIRDVVMATSTQVLEARDSHDPSVARALSVRGRQDAAILYLALGDADGNAVRTAVWERDGTEWQQSAYSVKLAAKLGLRRSEYDDLQRGLLPQHLPPADHPEVEAMVDDTAKATAHDQAEACEPMWITYAQIADLLR